MGKRRQEPGRLLRGKLFHKFIQEEWLATASGDLKPEWVVDQINGSKGRVDVFIDEATDGFVSVVEVKNTDWDKIADGNVRRNVRRQVRQIWRYIDSQLELRGLSVCAGIIFPTLPRDKSKLALIEAMFDQEGIQVVWHDEPIEAVRARMRQKDQERRQVEPPGS